MLEWRYDALHEQKWRYYDYDFFSLSLAPFSRNKNNTLPQERKMLEDDDVIRGREREQILLRKYENTARMPHTGEEESTQRQKPLSHRTSLT